MEELEQFVEAVIFRRRTERLGKFEIEDDDDNDENFTWDEMRVIVEKARWTPPPGGKTPHEMLREDRDG